LTKDEREVLKLLFEAVYINHDENHLNERWQALILRSALKAGLIDDDHICGTREEFQAEITKLLDEVGEEAKIENINLETLGRSLFEKDEVHED